MIIIIVIIIIKRLCCSFYTNQHTAGGKIILQNFGNHRNANTINQRVTLPTPLHHWIHRLLLCFKYVEWHHLQWNGSEDINTQKKEIIQHRRCVVLECRQQSSRTIESRQSKMDDGNTVALILLLMAPLLKNVFLFKKKKQSPRNKWHDTQGRAIQSNKNVKKNKTNNTTKLIFFFVSFRVYNNEMASRQLQQDDSEKEENEDNFDRKKSTFHAHK